MPGGDAPSYIAKMKQQGTIGHFIATLALNDSTVQSTLTFGGIDAGTIKGNGETTSHPWTERGSWTSMQPDSVWTVNVNRVFIGDYYSETRETAHGVIDSEM